MNCIFCDLSKPNIPKLVENDYFYVIKDIEPMAPLHLLIISKRHCPSFQELLPEELCVLSDLLLKINEIMTLDNDYRLIINTGLKSGQTVNHVHIHVLSGRTLNWPPG